MSYYLCCGFNAMVKLTACVYRPWIRDARVLPAGDAIRTATGYSFPSGHATTAGPIYGGLAVSAKPWRESVSVLLILLALVTGFSRNYLGVHTPQDVAVGLLEAALALFAAAKLFRIWAGIRRRRTSFCSSALPSAGWGSSASPSSPIPWTM